MRHRKSGRKLGRNSAHRKAMFRNMTTSLLEHETIKTTLPKAKELRRHAEPVINVAKKHAWSKYAASLEALDAALAGLEAAFAEQSEENKAVFAAVKASRAKIEKRFPSGLGSLLRVVQAMGDEVAEQAAVLADVRTKQMARQHAISKVNETVTKKEIIEKLFGDLGERFVGRDGGYTRIVKAGYREGDNAAMAYVSLVFESVVKGDSEAAESEEAEEAAE
jgi:ribosomal protein L17